MTRPYAEVIGDPIAQSKSPIIHGFWLDACGIDADYTKQHVRPDELKAYLEQRRADPNWRGCNVTMPHKQSIMGLLDVIEAPADAIGAVNTVYRQPDGKLAGTNTDATGFLEPVRPLLDQKHLFRMARIMGTGGAARAIVSALFWQGFTLVLAGRNPEKAAAMLGELAPEGEHYPADIAHFAAPTDFAFDDREGCCDLIINASPLGMRGQPPLKFDFSHAPPGSVVYDIVTDPAETDFLKRAHAAGFATIDGLAMLIGQAAAAFAIFFDQQPPRDRDDALRELLSS